MEQASAKVPDSLLSPDDHVLMMIDFQSPLALALRSVDPEVLRDNASLVAHAASVFKVPVILTTIANKSFSSLVLDEVREAFPGLDAIDRSMSDAWEDPRIPESVNKIGRKKIVMAGLRTSVCIADSALSALDQDYEVYVIADTCGDVTKEAHDRAVERMTRRGSIPVTALQYLLELQRDWARKDIYQSVNDLAGGLGGEYGVGGSYGRAMLRTE